MKRKIILPILIVLVLGGGVVYYKAVTQPQPLILTGIVTTNDVVASSQIQGQLAQVLVKEGDTVKAGQLLAVIEPQELRADESFYLHTERGTAAQVTEAEAALKYQEAQTRDQIKQAEASLAAAQAQEDEAKADLELDRLNYQRTKGLYDQKIDIASSRWTRRAPPSRRSKRTSSLSGSRWKSSARRSPSPGRTKTRSPCGEANCRPWSGNRQPPARRCRRRRFAWTIRRFTPPFPASFPCWPPVRVKS